MGWSTIREGETVTTKTDLYRPIWETSLAARHLGAKPADVIRWVQGYPKGDRRMPPIIRRKDPADPYVNFMDFVELLYLRAMRDAGITLPRIKKAYDKLQELFGHDIYPLATHGDFYQLGRDLVIVTKDGGKLNPDSQLLFEEVVLDIGNQIKVEDKNHLPVEWWPLTQQRRVVLRPGFNGSNPSVENVPTQAVYGLYVAEKQDIGAVTNWFDISEDAVRDAIVYEEGLVKKKAA